MTPDRSARLLWAAPFFAVGPIAALAPRSLLTVLLAACALGLVLHVWRRRAFPPPAWRIALPLGLFAAYAGVSASWSLVPGSALSQLFKLTYLFGAALLCAAMLSTAPEQARRAASWALVGGTLVGVALLLFDTAAGYPMLRALHGADSSGDVGAPAINRTVVAMATLIWPAALALASIAGPAWSWPLPIGYLGLSALTTSQSATLGIATGLFAYALASLSVRTARYFALGVLLIGLTGAVPIARLAYSAGLSDAAWLQESARHRIEVWNFAADRAMRRPVFGFGLDSSRAIPNEGDASRFKSWTDNIIPLHTHNVFLQLWLELGAVGAALGFLVGATLLRAAAALDDAAQRFVIAAFMCNLAIAGVTSFSMWQGWWASALIVSALCLLPSLRPTAPTPEKNRAAR